MAIPAGVYRVVFAGNMPGGEIWSTGFWVEGDAPTSNDLASATADLWWDEATANDESGAIRYVLENYASPSVTLETISVYSYPAGGKTAEFIGVHTQSLAGEETGNYHPNQCTIVASLRTGAAGRRARGRMYLPLNAVNVGADGQIAASAATGIATSVATMFSDWNGSSGNGKIAVVSQAATQAREVTSVVVDTRYDVQRRRAASQIIDGRSSQPVTNT